MVRENEYLLQLFEEIEQLRKNSISNMNKTDLYTREDIYKIINWYDQLVLACKMTPPTSWVDTLCAVVKSQSFSEHKPLGYIHHKCFLGIFLPL